MRRHEPHFHPGRNAGAQAGHPRQVCAAAAYCVIDHLLRDEHQSMLSVLQQCCNTALHVVYIICARLGLCVQKPELSLSALQKTPSGHASHSPGFPPLFHPNPLSHQPPHFLQRSQALSVAQQPPCKGFPCCQPLSSLNFPFFFLQRTQALPVAQQPPCQRLCSVDQDHGRT